MDQICFMRKRYKSELVDARIKCGSQVMASKFQRSSKNFWLRVRPPLDPVVHEPPRTNRNWEASFKSCRCLGSSSWRKIRNLKGVHNRRSIDQGWPTTRKIWQARKWSKMNFDQHQFDLKYQEWATKNEERSNLEPKTVAQTNVGLVCPKLVKKNNSSDLSCSAHTLLFQCICSFSDTQEKHENQRAKTQTSRLPRCSSALFSKEILVQWGHSLQLCRLVSKPRTQNKSELYCSGWWYTYPSEKYESQGEPNHQPVFIKPICFSRPTLPKMTKSVDPPYWIASLYVEQTQGDFQRCAQIAGGPSSNTILFAIPTHT